MEKPRHKTEEDWPYKLLIFFLKIDGVHLLYFKAGLRSKIVLYVRWAVVLLECFFFLHCVAAILVHLTHETKHRLREVIFCIQYAGIALYSAGRNYTLLTRRTDIAYLLKNCHERKLHCSAAIDDGPIWRRHTRGNTIVWVAYVLVAKMVGLVMVGVVSPFVRFVVRQEFLYVLRHVWYPASVLTNSVLFWMAAVYEWILVLDTSQALIIPDLLYLYFVMAAVVKSETLSKFLVVSLHALHNGKRATRLRRTDESTDSHKPDEHFERKKELFKKSIHDWNMIWRESQLINRVYYPAACWGVLTGVSNNAIMTYIAINEIRRNSGFSASAFVQSLILFYHVLTGVLLMYATSYAATLLRDARENLRHSLWRCDWFMENLEFKKMFLHFDESLSRSVEMRALKLQPCNVESFSRNFSRAYSYVRFLLHITRKK